MKNAHKYCLSAELNKLLVKKVKLHYSIIMSSRFDISAVLRSYALKFNSPSIEISDLCDYFHKNAHRYIQEHPSASVYVDISEDRLLKELQPLEREGKIEIFDDKKKGIVLFVPYYFLDTIIRRYDSIRERPELPFPLVTEVPAHFSKRFLRSLRINIDFTKLSPEKGSDSFLYQLIFLDDTPPLIFPGNFSADQMLELAIAKLRCFFNKDELRDFVQKKLLSANPGKEYSIRKFINSIQSNSSEALYSIQKSGDSYLFWSYLCSVIKQEFSKKPEKLLDEIGVIQSIYIIEYLNNYYKNQTQQNLQRETALKNLDLAFQKKPYYFNKAAIINFKDSRGLPLLGQYSEEDLEQFIEERTTASLPTSLPQLLSFRLDTGERYYVLIERVVPLIISLVNDNRRKIRDICLKTWYHQLFTFEQTDAMHSDTDFNLFVKKLCSEHIPILYSLLNSSFITALVNDPQVNTKQATELKRLFANDKLLAYNDLFMLNRQELLTDTKILLPFWYTIPILSSIMAFFMRPRSKKTASKNKTQEKTENNSKPVRKLSLKEAANALKAEILPDEKDLQEAIIEQLDVWNTTIEPITRKQNTDNVNAFIRDYIKTLNKRNSLSDLTLERLHSISDTLIHTSGLAAVKNKAALKLYAEYYILWLIQHSI